MATEATFNSHSALRTSESRALYTWSGSQNAERGSVPTGHLVTAVGLGWAEGNTYVRNYLRAKGTTNEMTFLI